MADTINDVGLQARCSYFLAYDGEFRRALELTDRTDALYGGLDRRWDQAANWLFAARAAISARDQARSIDAVARVERWLVDVDDPWLHVRHEAVRGELARIRHRFHDAVDHMRRAAETGARTALEQADAWHRAAGGGEEADLGECLLAAMGADGPRADAELKLTVLLAEAQRDDLAHVEVFALDALARMAADAGDLARSRELCATADRRLEDAAHSITDFDRLDARYVRELV